MGRLAETAILSQWFHSEFIERLHYARWHNGEVDLVHLEPANAGVGWAGEVKWSDRHVENPRRLRNLLGFAQANGLKSCLVTTRTVTGTSTVHGIRLDFVPASLYCYWVGRNIVRQSLGAHPLVVREPPPQRELPI